MIGAMTHSWLRSDWNKTTRPLPLCWPLSWTTTQFDSIYLKCPVGVSQGYNRTQPPHHTSDSFCQETLLKLSQSCVSYYSSLLFAGKLLDLHGRVQTCNMCMITWHTALGGWLCNTDPLFWHYPPSAYQRQSSSNMKSRGKGDLWLS